MKTNVYHFTNYREFLRSWIEEKKSSVRPMSIRQFARKAAISSPNYLQRVMNTEVKLSDTMVDKLIKGLSMGAREAEYFRTLVRFNQAGDATTKLEQLRALEKISKNSQIKEIQDHNLFKEWYYPVIWELASCKDFVLTPESAAEALKKSVSKREAREAIEFLERSGYLLRDAATGRYSQRPATRLKSTDEIANCSLQALHRKLSSLAAESLELPVSEREFQELTIAISPEKMLLAKQLIKKAATEILDQLSNDSEADRVYCLNFQLFPLTEKTSPKPQI